MVDCWAANQWYHVRTLPLDSIHWGLGRTAVSSLPQVHFSLVPISVIHLGKSDAKLSYPSTFMGHCILAFIIHWHQSRSSIFFISFPRPLRSEAHPFEPTKIQGQNSDQEGQCVLNQTWFGCSKLLWNVGIFLQRKARDFRPDVSGCLKVAWPSEQGS